MEDIWATTNSKHKIKLGKNSDNNKIIITNYNRDGAKIWFERIDNSDNYTINTNKSFVLEYMRCIYKEANNDSIYDFEMDGKKYIYIAIDPSGGPYINVGAEFDGYKVNRFFDKDNKICVSLTKI